MKEKGYFHNFFLENYLLEMFKQGKHSCMMNTSELDSYLFQAIEPSMAILHSQHPFHQQSFSPYD